MTNSPFLGSRRCVPGAQAGWGALGMALALLVVPAALAAPGTA